MHWGVTASTYKFGRVGGGRKYTIQFIAGLIRKNKKMAEKLYRIKRNTRKRRQKRKRDKK